MGQYEKAVVDSLEALRRAPDSYIAYTNLILIYASLNSLDDSAATYQKMHASHLDYPPAHASLYGIAAARGDAAGMLTQVIWATNKIGIEDILLAEQADTEAFYGRLGEAREFSRRAIESAQRAGKTETVAIWKMNAALRESEFGNTQNARNEAAAAMDSSSSRYVQTLAALTMAQSGNAEKAHKISDELARHYPLDTLINGYWLPTIRAAIKLDRNQPAQAIDLLKRTESFELVADASNPEWAAPLHPAYLRGQAYLQLHRGKAAALEYQKFIDHWGAVRNFQLGALARLGLARAYAMQEDWGKAHAAYESFFILWKDADADIPILRQAKAEYANLR